MAERDLLNPWFGGCLLICVAVVVVVNTLDGLARGGLLGFLVVLSYSLGEKRSRAVIRSALEDRG